MPDIETLIGLKRASGTTAPHLDRDLVGIMELIRTRDPERACADRVDESVRPDHDLLWDLARVKDDNREPVREPFSGGFFFADCRFDQSGRVQLSTVT